MTLGGNCSTSRAIFAVAATKPPYNVYGTPFGGVANCGGVFSVDDNGALDEQIQNYTYSSSSGVHGLALNSDNTFLYSADDTANTLWTHSVDSTTGKVTLVSSISGPATGSDPRHVTVHPTGQYLYVILEGANKVAQYTIDQSTGIPSFENVSYSLLPADIAGKSPSPPANLTNNQQPNRTLIRSTGPTKWLSLILKTLCGPLLGPVVPTPLATFLPFPSLPLAPSNPSSS